MSILIKGMAMPRNCCECDIRSYDANAGEEYCPFSQIECLSIGRQNDCPLVEIPSHGKLIDANALMSVYSDSILDVACVYGPNSSEAGILVGAMKLLEVQPTVIEAEDAE